jgi:hypothetical protein
MQSQSDRDARIKDRAYQIWLSEGRPHGRDEAHWHRAEREVEAEATGAGSADTGGTRPTRPMKAPVASEADLPTVSEARAENEAMAKKTRTRAAATANADTGPATSARPKSTSRGRNNAKT